MNDFSKHSSINKIEKKDDTSSSTCIKFADKYYSDYLTIELLSSD